MVPFNTKELRRDPLYTVKTHLISEDSNEFIITVFMNDQSLEAEIVKGVNKALNRTRELAEVHTCDYSFNSFPKR